MSRYLRTFWYLTLTTKSIQLFFFKVPQKPIKPIRAEMQPRAISIGAPIDSIVVSVVPSTVFNTADGFLVICDHIPNPAVTPPPNYSGGERKVYLFVGYSLIIYQITFTYSEEAVEWKPALNIFSPSCRCCLSVVREMSVKTRKCVKTDFCHHLLTIKLFQTCMNFFFCWTQSGKILIAKQLTVAIDLFLFFHTIEFNGYINCWLPRFLKIKKEMMTEFSFLSELSL